MSTTTMTFGLNHPVLITNTKRLNAEVDKFEADCASKSAQIQEFIREFAVFEHLAAREDGDQSRVLSGLVAATVEADIQLSPRENALQTQISRTKSLIEVSGSNPELLGVYPELSNRVERAAKDLRKQRELSKEKLAPATTWMDQLTGKHSRTRLQNLVCEITTAKKVILIPDN